MTRQKAIRSVSLLAIATTSLVIGGGARAARTVRSDAPTATAMLTDLGASPQRTMAMVLVLPLRDASGAADFISHVSLRGDPLYHRFLSPQAFAERFGARADDYKAVANWAVQHGLSLGEASIGRSILSVRGTTAQVEAAFGIRMHDYQTADGKVFYAASGTPEMPDAIAASVSGVIGLSSFNQMLPLAITKPASAPMKKGGPIAGLSAADLRSVYSVAPQTPDKPTETLAVFEQGGYDPTDIAVYLSQNKLASVPVQPRLVNGYGGAISSFGIELEAVLDIDMEIALNPAAKQILVYEDGYDPFGVALLDSLTAMANDDVAQTISISYGTDEAIEGATQIAAEAPLFMQLAAQGQEVFVSSGDQGAYGRSGVGYNAPDPGSQPYVTSVGGTTLFLQPKAQYATEEVWNGLGSIYRDASGGGVSSYWTIPDYQLTAHGTRSVAKRNGGSSTFRNVPDVAAVADPFTGVAVYSKLNGGWITEGGTSASAPIWAGFYSLVNATSKGLGLGPVGFFNPALYAFSKMPSTAFFDEHDVQDGTNGNKPLYHKPGYSAGPGYDDATGWGSFQGSDFVRDFLLDPLFGSEKGPPPPNGLSGSATPTTITLAWTSSPGATGYFVLGYDINTGTRPAMVTQADHVTFTGLRPGNQYNFGVYAVNKKGTNYSPILIVTPKS